MIDACWWMKAEINNGAFHQYFENSAGDHRPFVMQALIEGGDTEGIRIFEGALGIFPDGKPAMDRGKRWEQLDEMRKQDEQAMWDHFEKYTDDYHKHPFPDEKKLVWVIASRKADIALVWPA